MKYYADEKPTLDSLTHFGVKGMKWGVRTKKDKPTTQEIHAARNRINAKAAHLESQAWKTAAQDKGSAAEKRAIQKHNSMLIDFLNDPDHKTANKMTKGEKWTAGLGLALGLGGVALQVAGARR